MRNHRSNKVREYRKSLRGAKGTISLWKLFYELHPEYDRPHRWWPEWTTWWDYVEEIRIDWFSQLAQTPAGDYSGCGNAPAHFRRDLNRMQRSREKQALRNAISNDADWEDFTMPRHRRDADWLWW